MCFGIFAESIRMSYMEPIRVARLFSKEKAMS